MTLLSQVRRLWWTGCAILAVVYSSVLLTPPEHAGHAREVVRDYDISSIDGIVISSGDGLLYEVCVVVCM